MSSGCSLSRSVLVRELTHMTGLSVPLFIRARMPAEEIRGSITTAVCLALILGKVLVDEEICVNMLMVCSNAGYTQLNTVHASARMAQAVQGGFASLHIRLRSLGHCTFLLDLLSPLLGQLQRVSVSWIWLLLCAFCLVLLLRSLGCLLLSINPCLLTAMGFHTLQLVGLSQMFQLFIFLEATSNQVV